MFSQSQMMNSIWQAVHLMALVHVAATSCWQLNLEPPHRIALINSACNQGPLGLYNEKLI